jgi:hypothetical protein
VKDLYGRKLHYENARQVQELDFQEVHYRTNLEIGDVLVTNAGTIGRVAVARDSDKVGQTTFQKSIAVLKPIKEVVQSDFLAMYIENSVSHLNKKSSGTAVKNLLLRDLKEFTIALPSIEEQIEIVHRVEELLAFADRLGANYQNTYLQLDRLSNQSLLKPFEVNWLIKIPTMNLPPCCSIEFGQSDSSRKARKAREPEESGRRQPTIN